MTHPSSTSPARSRPGDGDPSTGFSLLLAVWAGDRPDYLERAVRSSVQEQTRRPDELVVVEDGPLPAELSGTLDRLAAQSPVPVVRVRLARNVGLGPVLDAGLGACSHDVVARIDADDVSLPHRFEVEVPVVESGAADLVGSALLEFENDEREVVGLRVPPTSPAAIERAARLHDPFNHPSVVYRRSAVQAAGGYQALALMEDYWLFARMIARGARVANLGEPLVLYRVGDGAYARRGGGRLLVSELRLQWRMRRIGFTTRSQLVRNVAVRGLYRVVPAAVRRPLYRALVAGRGPRLDGDATGRRGASMPTGLPTVRPAGLPTGASVGTYGRPDSGPASGPPGVVVDLRQAHAQGRGRPGRGPGRTTDGPPGPDTEGRTTA